MKNVRKFLQKIVFQIIFQSFQKPLIVFLGKKSSKNGYLLHKRTFGKIYVHRYVNLISDFVSLYVYTVLENIFKRAFNYFPDAKRKLRVCPGFRTHTIFLGSDLTIFHSAKMWN